MSMHDQTEAQVSVGDDVKITSCPTYEVSIYMGLNIGYSDAVIPIEDVKKIVCAYQEQKRPFCAVTCTELEYLVGQFREKGFKLTAINYPRYPMEPHIMRNFMFGLARHLLYTFQQNRISVVCPRTTVLFTHPEAEDHPVTNPAAKISDS